MPTLSEEVYNNSISLQSGLLDKEIEVEEVIVADMEQVPVAEFMLIGSNAPAQHEEASGTNSASISGIIFIISKDTGGVNHNCSCSVNNGGGQGGQGGRGNGSSLGYGNGSYNNGTAGAANTGGGGGGTDPESTTANAGGSGIVIIRYLGNPAANGGSISQSGGYTIHTGDKHRDKYFASNQNHR